MSWLGFADVQRNVKQPVTQREIARSLGVSVSAVSLALSGRTGVGSDLRDRIRERAAELGYRPNASAVALRTRRSQVLGLLIRNLRNPFFLDVVDGFDETCASAGYEVMIGSSRYDREREQELLDAFQDRGVDGIAVAPIGVSPAVSAWAAAKERPVVLLNAPAQRRTRDPRPMMSVCADGAGAVELAVRHLLQLGHRELALVVAPADKDPEPERLQRFRALSRTLGFTARTVRTELSADATRIAVGREFRRRSRPRPTAFITNSDYLAQAVYLEAADHGLRVPEDVSVIGHDDLPTAALLAPPLTTLRVDRRDIGRRAATLLIDALEGRPPTQRNITVDVELQIRQSTSAVAPPR